EKHFTLDCSLEGPDQNASLEPVEFKRLVDAVRHIELAMGNGIKEPAKPEIANRAIVRKSLVAKQDIEAGTILDMEMVCTKRPGNGIPAIEIYDYLGKELKQSVKTNSLFEEKHFA
ncbi:MAG: N-acetylneuraminate synthase family protein, partial [Lentisphaeria bacterium]|nr:N-acetylneuraminate synthase family protein [Lentisphaeria bacterium]